MLQLNKMEKNSKLVNCSRGRGRGRGRGRKMVVPKEVIQEKVETVINDKPSSPPPQEQIPQLIDPIEIDLENNTLDMDADITQLEAPTFSTINKAPPEPMLRLNWNHKTHLIGEKVINPMIHCCDICQAPILTYGRMFPCKHVFCIACAERQSKFCPRCHEKVTRIEKSGLGSVFMCSFGGSPYGNTGCRRTYLSQRDLQAHINHRHVTSSNATVNKDSVSNTQAASNMATAPTTVCRTKPSSSAVQHPPMASSNDPRVQQNSGGNHDHLHKVVRDSPSSHASSSPQPTARQSQHTNVYQPVEHSQTNANAATHSTDNNPASQQQQQHHHHQQQFPTSISRPQLVVAPPGHHNAVQTSADGGVNPMLMMTNYGAGVMSTASSIVSNSFLSSMPPTMIDSSAKMGSPSGMPLNLSPHPVANFHHQNFSPQQFAQVQVSSPGLAFSVPPLGQNAAMIMNPIPQPPFYAPANHMSPYATNPQRPALVTHFASNSPPVQNMQNRMTAPAAATMPTINSLSHRRPQDLLMPPFSLPPPNQWSQSSQPNQNPYY